MHTADTMQSMSRILEFFPESEHKFIRSALATSLKAVCAQRLLPAVPDFNEGRGGVVPATEVLLNTPIVRERVRDGLFEDLPAIVAASTAEGMRTFTLSLAELVKSDVVSLRVAMDYAPNREMLDAVLKGVQMKAQTLVGKIRSGGG
jgi:twitching motility protein PilU